MHARLLEKGCAPFMGTPASCDILQKLQEYTLEDESEGFCCAELPQVLLLLAAEMMITGRGEVCKSTIDMVREGFGKFSSREMTRIGMQIG